MKRMTYKSLMKKMEDGKMEVNAWTREGTDTSYADVTIWPANMNKPPKRETVEVYNIPQEFWGVA